MADSMSFPLFVFEKDDCSMFRVEGPDKVLYHMESIDIENAEYLLWDSKGNGVQISVAGKHVTAIDSAAVEISLSEAFKRHSDAFGLRVDATGPADEVWRRLREAEAQLPRKLVLDRLPLQKLLSRIFRSLRWDQPSLSHLLECRYS